jgi:hypothetical protein
MSARDRLTAMYVPTSDADETDWEQRLNAYRAEVLAEAAPPCAVCDTSIEWVACPTGGWWAHHNHPEDGHDALPPGVPSRTEVLAEVARLFDDRGRALLDGGIMTAADAAELIRQHAAAPVPATEQDDIGTAVPNYFRPGHTYTRPSHGRQVEFQVTQVSTAPDGSQRRAFGWHRIEGYSSWSDYSNDDYATWTDTTAPTPADGYAGTRGEPGPVNQ